MFGTRKCGRLLYLSILLGIIALDYAKTPLEEIINQVRDMAVREENLDGKTAEELRERGYIVTNPGETVVFDFDQNQFLGFQKPDPGKRTLSPRLVQSGWNFAEKIAIDLVKTGAVNGIYIAVIWGLGFASLLILAWAVFARIRDIGWSRNVGFGIMALMLSMLWLSPINITLAKAFQFTLFAALAGLTFVPGDVGKGRPGSGATRRKAVQTTHTKPAPLFGDNARLARRR